MPPPKKAAKKTAKKAASKHDEGKDMRRAYEHRGRVEVLRPLLAKGAADIDLLIRLGEEELAASQMKDAADLFRAAEHLSFGYLASSKSDKSSAPPLVESIEQEFHHKLEKAEEHWEEPEVLSAAYQRALDGAQKSFERRAYRKALELARAAEAIAHVHLHDEEVQAT